jgi:anhydro-N-acetylmuramic acid kinase
MVYKAIGLMSGSSLDGLDIIFAHFHDQAGTWSFEIRAADCYGYTAEWEERLGSATDLPAREYLLLHTRYGRYLAENVLRFMEEKNIQLQADLIASHGHTTFHAPWQGMTAQLGDGAVLAAETNMAVVSDLRALDVALGGQGAPIVPVGEKLLFPEYDLFLNLGGIANISAHGMHGVTAFDICPANRVLNALARQLNKPYDDKGAWAAQGQVNENLLGDLNSLEYYEKPWPKSLANEFSTRTVLPLLDGHALSIQGKLRTYTAHIVLQTAKAAKRILAASPAGGDHKLLVTGGGAFNTFLVDRLRERLAPLNVTLVVPPDEVIKFKEALIMALLGVLRWRENNTTLASVTGARRDAIGGALWMGQEG